MARQRQGTDAPSARRVYGIADRGRDRDGADLPHATQGPAALDELGHHRRRFGQVRQLVSIEVVLLWAPILEGDLCLAVRKTEHDSTFDARFGNASIQDLAAID